jgi:hypothetical protein
MSDWTLPERTQVLLKEKIAAKEAADKALRDALALTFASMGIPEDAHVHFDATGKLVIHVHTHEPSETPVIDG